jgi:DNA recombination protein RmuC
MAWESFVILLIGVSIGSVATYAFLTWRVKATRELAAELLRENEAQRKANINELLDSVEANFGKLSLEAMNEFLQLAKTKLESERQLNTQELTGKKALIDQQLGQMTGELKKVSELVAALEKDRSQKFGELRKELEATTKQTSALIEATTILREALATSKVRGQWGERMAEDVLNIAGFVDGVNYVKQTVLAGPGTRPDFTFLLPNKLVLNMDVKFPLDNYVKYLEADSKADADNRLKDFLGDVRTKIKEVTSRDYIDPAQNTVDYALVFIPNEQIYGFIHENDRSLLDEAIKNRVVLCSPMTLFAVLAVIRQAVDNFALEKTSNEILSLFGSFKKQWGEFVKKMDTLGKRIEDAAREYDELRGVQRRQLEKPLEEIEEHRIRKGLPDSPDQNGDNVLTHEVLEVHGQQFSNQGDA